MLVVEDALVMDRWNCFAFPYLKNHICSTAHRSRLEVGASSSGNVGTGGRLIGPGKSVRLHRFGWPQFQLQPVPGWADRRVGVGAAGAENVSGCGALRIVVPEIDMGGQEAWKAA